MSIETFEAVAQAIAECAFVTSEMPIILSLEVMLGSNPTCRQPTPATLVVLRPQPLPPCPTSDALQVEAAADAHRLVHSALGALDRALRRHLPGQGGADGDAVRLCAACAVEREGQGGQKVEHEEIYDMFESSSANNKRRPSVHFGRGRASTKARPRPPFSVSPSSAELPQ